MKNDGGPAFPQEPRLDIDVFLGLSMRDYFAAHCPSDLARLGVRADAERLISKDAPDDIIAKLHWNTEVEAKLRYIYADAMLAERAK